MTDIILAGNPRAIRLEIGCNFCGAYLYTDRFGIRKHSVFCGLLRTGGENRNLLIGCDESPMGWGESIEEAVEDRRQQIQKQEN